METANKKIKCSVGILTLNSEKGLPLCLESLKDFDEIIVSDGNSTDRTVEIAKSFGTRVLKQYETDVPETKCVKDKASRRQKNMATATNDWYFFMDADDVLSKEVIEEIRSIVEDPQPKALIYRMPTRIFFEEEGGWKEIKHEATYPSYQTRLVHRSVGARFRGEVHDRLAFDEKRFPVGTMKGYYDFHWSKKRVKDFWSYLGQYALWEIETSRPSTIGKLLYWSIYRRLRTIVGYLLYRIPAMYIRYGFKDSMPIGIELTIVRYHFKILFGDIGKYISSRKCWIYAKEIMKGKDANRILTNVALREYECMGSILDIGGGGNKASHYRFLRLAKWHKVTTVDISPDAKPDHVLDIEKDGLPFGEGSFDYVFLFNVLEHLNDRPRALSEIIRVLKRVRSDSMSKELPESGRLVGVIPFLVNVHPDPHDFVRLTNEGLERFLASSGFSDITIKAVGRGPFTAGYYQFEFILPRILCLIAMPMALAMDSILNAMSGKDFSSKFPLSYIFHASKK